MKVVHTKRKSSEGVKKQRLNQIPIAVEHRLAEKKKVIEQKVIRPPYNVNENKIKAK